jgi:hypothetical protein
MGGPPGGRGPGGGSGGGGAVNGNQDLALAAGYVLVEPGCRGRENQAADGTYYGKGRDGFGTLTADNYGAYLLKYFLIPSANKYLKGLTDEKRTGYLAVNPWIAWDGDSASFSFKDYVAHVGRQKSLPANDVFDLSGSKTILFGNETTNARHFTNFALRKTTGDPNATVDNELQAVVNMMNPLYFIGQKNPGCTQYW